MTEIKHNDPFDNWNIFWLATTLLTVVALLIQLQIERTNFKADSLITLSLGIPSVLMMFQYRQLRKNKVFVAWTIIGIFLFIVFLWIKLDSAIQLKGNKIAYLGLKSPIAFLSAYYIFRKISLNFYGTELILPSKYGRFDSEEGRDSNLLDFISMFSYWIIIAVTCFN